MPYPIQSEPSWTRIEDSEPAQYTRPLQGSEIMHDCNGRLNDGLSNVVMGAAFKTTLSNEELESRALEAIGRMRFVIPILACTVKADPSNPFSASFVYTTPRDQADLRSWITSTLSIRHGAYGTEEFERFVLEMNSFKVPYVHPDGHEQPSHFYLLVSDSPTEDGERVHGLFMHGPHTIMDARPTLRCINALLDWIASPPSESLQDLSWGEEWKSLPVPPIAATGGIRDDWDTEGVKLVEEMNELLMHPVPQHGLVPARTKVTVPGNMTRVHVRLDRATSERVVRACKALGYTPSALFDAAVCLATFARNPVKPEDEDTAHFTFDPVVIAQDRYLVPPHNGLSHFIAGLALVTVRIPYNSIPRSAPVKEQLTVIMAQIKSQTDHFLSNPNLPHVLQAQQATAPPRMSESIKNHYACNTSNMGNLSLLLHDKVGEKGENLVEITDMVFGHRLHWLRIMLHCWSLNGQMRLQIQTSDAWDETAMHSFLEDIKNLMLSILHESS